MKIIIVSEAFVNYIDENGVFDKSTINLRNCN